MPLLSRRLDQIIARRRHARPRDRARNLLNLGYKIDGITEDLPTTEVPYERTPFIYDPYPKINDVPPVSEDEVLNRNRVIKFGTITEYPIDNNAYTHPSGSNFEPSDYPDWNRHAPILLDFFRFIDTTTDDVQKGEIISEYWRGHFRAPPVEAVIEEQLAARAQVARRIVPVPPLQDNNEDTSRVPTEVSLAEEHPSDEQNTDSSDDESELTTPSRRERRFNQYVEGPCVSCLLSPHFPGVDLNTATFGRTFFTHLDTSGHQFTILPGVDYHFNDVTVSLTENRTGLEILAICPEVVDITNLPDTTNPTTGPTSDTPSSPTNRPRKRKSYTTANARTYNLRSSPYQRTRTTTSTTDNSSVSTSSASSSSSEDTPPPSFYDRDYNPSDNDTDEEDLIIDTTDSATSTSNEPSDDSSYTTDHSSTHFNRTTYGLRSTGENWQQHIQEAVQNISLSVPETIDLTASDTEEETNSEPGDIIVLSEII
jgi:hypothetical protein